MHSLTLKDVARITGGMLHGDGNLVVTGVATDSHSVKPGDLFCAIVGERVDGHDFASDAFESGAIAVLGTREINGPCVVLEKADGLDAVIVALGELAKNERAVLHDVNVIGITGSSGKTSTKDIIGQVVAHCGVTQSPAGSPNNELGMPLTVLQASSDTNNYVLEMGMRGLGHIAYLCDIARPTIGVVTNVGLAHAGEVGGIKDIAKAKSELVRGLDENGCAILNADDVNVAAMATLAQGDVLTYGFADSADVRVSDLVIHPDGTSRFVLTHRGSTVTVDLPLMGRHNVSNAAAAAAVGIRVRMSLDDVARALNTVSVLSKWRMEKHSLPNDITLINDAYNANPDSMKAAFKTLSDFDTVGSRWAVIAGMHELGPSSDEEHAALGALAAELNIDHFVVIGDLARPALDSALAAGIDAVWLPEISQASDYIGQKVAAHDVLLFKASRSEGLERLAALVQGRIERGVQQ